MGVVWSSPYRWQLLAVCFGLFVLTTGLVFLLLSIGLEEDLWRLLGGVCASMGSALAVTGTCWCVWVVRHGRYGDSLAISVPDCEAQTLTGDAAQWHDNIGGSERDLSHRGTSVCTKRGFYDDIEDMETDDELEDDEDDEDLEDDLEDEEEEAEEEGGFDEEEVEVNNQNAVVISGSVGVKTKLPHKGSYIIANHEQQHLDSINVGKVPQGHMVVASDVKGQCHHHSPQQGQDGGHIVRTQPGLNERPLDREKMPNHQKRNHDPPVKEKLIPV